MINEEKIKKICKKHKVMIQLDNFEKTDEMLDEIWNSAQKELLSELRSRVILDERNCMQESLLKWIETKERSSTK